MHSTLAWLHDTECLLPVAAFVPTRYRSVLWRFTPGLRSSLRGLLAELSRRHIGWCTRLPQFDCLPARNL